MILLIHNEKNCKEYLLPNLYNSDYSIVLQKEVYGLREDVSLILDITEDGWRIFQGKNYIIKTKEEKVKECRLAGKEILKVKTAYQERITIIVIDAVLSFRAMKKYDLRSVNEISIGRARGNTIVYEFMDLISSFHGKLLCRQNRWYAEDLSKNGMFCNSRRIQRKKALVFGDQISIFGLQLVFLGDTLAVGNHYGQLEIEEKKLKEISYDEGILLAITGENRQGEYFNRPPRNLPRIETEPIEIEGPPAPKIMKQRPLLLTIGPSFTMAIPMLLGCILAAWGSRLTGRGTSVFMYTGIVTALSAAIIGVVWAFTNMNYSKKEQQEEEQQRFNAYSAYLTETAEKIRKKYKENERNLQLMYPSAQNCVQYYNNRSYLWSRNTTHKDFLYQRLGIGEMPFQVPIQVPKEKFTLTNDILAEKPGMIKREYETLYQVPIGISLADYPIVGLVGGKEKTGAMNLMYILAAQIAANNCYTDVKMIFVSREEDCRRKEEWECVKWFPHVWSEDKQTRYLALSESEKGDLFFELVNIIRNRSQKQVDGKSVVKPHYILFLSDPSLLEGELLAKYIYHPQKEYGLTTCIMVEHVEQLPNACEEIIQNDKYFTGMYNLLDMTACRTRIQFDRAEPEMLEEMGRGLAGIQVNETEISGEIPVSLDFFKMYQVKTLEEFQVLDRWRKNRTYNSMKALIGRKAGNAPCYLDIHEKFHGPHGLVAGTTGSGKSETLQTFIISLALNFSPEDVSFFIIDFKGGGMANLFEELPHMAGQISNLSGNQVRRAMISIKCENIRRQKLFTQCGVNHIDQYTRLFKNKEVPQPIPHLFIIIDEFAELKREEPEFMRELISIAQVGRSLGVHLILATQKPNGTVDDNIWSNSKFRLCLRVQDRRDSNDMLHKPDAAFLTQAGRCYLQVGNDELYELFQSGWSGAVYEEREKDILGNEASILSNTGKPIITLEIIRRRKKAFYEKLTGKQKKDITQLEAITGYLKKIALENGYRPSMKLWLPVLPSFLVADQLEGWRENYREGKWDFSEEKWELQACIGRYDDPQNREQGTLKIDFVQKGNYAVCGFVSSGKSTFLQTVIYTLLVSYDPQHLNLYLLDFSSRMLASFKNAPQVGGVICEGQDDKLKKFFHMIGKILEERKEEIQGGSFGQYVRNQKKKMPGILIVIDNIAGFREKTGNVYDDFLVRLAREGGNYGIYLLLSAAGIGTGEIPSKLADQIRSMICLEQSDHYKYKEILRTSRLALIPETEVKGRGLAYVGEEIMEFQTALCTAVKDDFERGRYLEERCKEMRQSWKWPQARKIPEIPKEPVLEQLECLPEYKLQLQTGDRLPLGYVQEDASCYGINLRYQYCYTVFGKSRCGKTNALKIIMDSASRISKKLCIIDSQEGELKLWAEKYGGEYIFNSKGILDYFTELTPEFIRRNQLKREMLSAGRTEEEIYQKMKEQGFIFLFVGNLETFFEMVYHPQEGVGKLHGFMENIMEKGRMHGIYFFGCINQDQMAGLGRYKAFQAYLSCARGIHLGGNVVMQKLFSFQNIPYSEASKLLKKGYGYVADEEDDTLGIKIVVPLARSDQS